MLFCCQKSAIYYQTQNKKRLKTLFQDNVGRKYIIKAKVIDETLEKQFQQSKQIGSLYVIDIKDDSLQPVDNNLTVKEKLENINLNHMAIILNEDNDHFNKGITKEKHGPKLNIYNLGILCFMSCIDCNEDGCPGKSPCSKLAIDMVRLWSALGYNPEKRNVEKESKIREELKEIYHRGTGLAKGLSKFICDEIIEW